MGSINCVTGTNRLVERRSDESGEESRQKSELCRESHSFFWQTVERVAQQGQIADEVFKKPTTAVFLAVSICRCRHRYDIYSRQNGARQTFHQVLTTGRHLTGRTIERTYYSPGGGAISPDDSTVIANIAP